MIIRALSKNSFDETMRLNGINDRTVELIRKTFFISINDSESTTPHKPWFNQNHENVLVLHFDDTEWDMTIPIVGDRYVQHVKAFTVEQAEQLYNFILKHIDKEYCYIHCTAGINRSGSVAKFINDVVGGDYDEFMRLNPQIQGNPLVTKLLKEQLYKNEFLPMFTKDIEPTPFTLEEVKQIAHDVMNLGMTLHQNQLNGTDTRSGNEVLEGYLRGLD